MKKIFIILLSLLIMGCIEMKSDEGIKQTGTLNLTSPGFKDNEVLPDRYTCRGEDVSPELIIKNIPEGTKSFALLLDDPDAPSGVWNHWVLWNIPAVSRIEENSVPEGAVEGVNDFGIKMYKGPCPPAGSGTHRYQFKLFALNTLLSINSSSNRDSLLDAIKGKIIEQTQLTGLFSRQ